MTVWQPPGATSWRYDAFLSYSHHDRLPVQGLHKALERIARPLGKRQALRVFRDDTDLTASPDLWGGVVQAMDQARYFVLVMSPRSKTSVWVNRELEHWLRARGPETLLLVLAQGRVYWHQGRQAFVPEYSDAAPEALTRPGVLRREPAYLDVSQYGPWDPRSPAFRAQVTGLAAAIRQVSRRDLENDDLRESRRRAWVRRAVTGALAALTVLSLVLFGVAQVAGREASAARVTSEAKRIAATAESLRGSNNALAIGLAREAVAMTSEPLPEARKALANAKAAFAEDPLQPLGVPISAHDGAVLDVTFAPDGKTFVTGGEDGAVRLWDLADRTQSGHDLRSPSDAAVYSVAMSERVIAASGAGEVLLWDATSREPLTSVPAGSWVDALCFDPKGDRLAWAEPGRVVVRDVGRNVTLRTFPMAKHNVNDLAFSQGGKLLAAIDAGGTVTVWDMTSGKRTFTTTLGSNGYAVAFRPDGENILAATTTDRMIHLYNADDKYAHKSLQGHNDAVFSLAYTGDSYMISGSADGSIGLWDTDIYEQVGQPRPLGRGVVNAVAFSGQSDALVSVDRDGGVSMWAYHAVPWQPARIAALDALPGGTRWLTGGDSTVTVRDGREKLRTIHANGQVEVARFLPGGGNRVITAGAGHVPQIWDVGTGEPVADLPYPRDLLKTEVDDAAVDPDGVRVAFADGDFTARVWKLGDRSLEAAFTDEGKVLTVALDGHGRLAYGGQADKLIVRDLAGGSELWRKNLRDWAMDVEFSPDGRYVLAGIADGTAVLYDAANGDEIRRFPGQRDRVYGVAFSPDGGAIALAARRDGVRVWDVETGAELARLLQQPADPGPFAASLPDVRTIRFTRGGRDLVGGDAYDLRTWPDLLDSATGCEIAIKHVSRAQMEPYLPAGHALACPYGR